MLFEKVLIKIKSFQVEIADVVVLSTKKALVCFETLFQIVNIDHELYIDQENPYKPEVSDIIIEENAKIEFVCTTVPTHLAYTADFDKMARVIIMVVLATNQVKVYDYNKKSEKINLLATVQLVNIDQVSKQASMFCVDENYQIEYIMTKKLYEFESNLPLAVRFAIADAHKPYVNCVSVYKNGEQKTETIDENTFKLINYIDESNNKFEILGFFENKIALKMPIGRRSVDIFIHDLGNV
jgi:hypothetical protein